MGVAQAKKMTAQISMNEAQTTDTIFAPIASFLISSTYTRGFCSLGGAGGSKIEKNHIICQHKRWTSFLTRSGHFEFSFFQQPATIECVTLKYGIWSVTFDLIEHNRKKSQPASANDWHYFRTNRTILKFHPI